ncbi:MAG: adenylosuccinate lyase, partial [Bacteroidota bacterium]
MELTQLTAISPVDGRYRSQTASLSAYFSEFALIKYRVHVEVEYFIFLSEKKFFKLPKATVTLLRERVEAFSIQDAEAIKTIEKTTNHDVKAVEYFLKNILKDAKAEGITEWIHFGLTSQDINNTAIPLSIKDFMEQTYLPAIINIKHQIANQAKQFKNVTILARTHGQPASPTTFGKEMKVYEARLEKQIKNLQNIKIQAKLNGASGNWNAHLAAYPKINWMKFTKDFINGLNKNRTQKLEANLITTQIECHDSYVAVFDTVRRINTILLDFNQDMWRYISDNWIIQTPKKGEVGSSTMPHKINPIDFENSEGNLGLANALFEFFARKLPISRLQRDLSDSTVERAFGTAFGHSYLAYTSLLKGLSKISVNENKIKEDLLAHPEVIAEAI